MTETITKRETTPEGAVPRPDQKVFHVTRNDTTVERLLSILEMYPKGASREWLSYVLEIDDRGIREAVRRARNRGHVICSNSDIKGYRLGDRDDATRTIAEFRSRARRLNETADAMERTLLEQEQGQQLRMEIDA